MNDNHIWQLVAAWIVFLTAEICMYDMQVSRKIARSYAFAVSVAMASIAWYGSSSVWMGFVDRGHETKVAFQAFWINLTLENTIRVVSSMRFLGCAVIALVCLVVLYRGTNFDRRSPIRKIFSFALSMYVGVFCWLATGATLKSWKVGVLLVAIPLALAIITFFMEVSRRSEDMEVLSSKLNAIFKKWKDGKESKTK